MKHILQLSNLIVNELFIYALAVYIYTNSVSAP